MLSRNQSTEPSGFAEVPGKSPGMPNAIQRQREVLQALSDRVDALAGRLAPIVLLKPQAAETPTPFKDSGCQLANAIQENTHDIVSIGARIEALMNSLEI